MSRRRSSFVEAKVKVSYIVWVWIGIWDMVYGKAMLGLGIRNTNTSIREWTNNDQQGMRDDCYDLQLYEAREGR